MRDWFGSRLRGWMSWNRRYKSHRSCRKFERSHSTEIFFLQIIPSLSVQAILAEEFRGRFMELIFRFSLLNVAHNSLDISYVSINIKFPLAACIVHITYFPKNWPLFPTLKPKPEGLVDATCYVKERLTGTIVSFNYFYYRRNESNHGNHAIISLRSSSFGNCTSFLLWYRMMLGRFQERTLVLNKIRR